MPPRQRGVVLIMVVAILATLAIAGTAFVMVMGQESKAASSTLYLAQAELAARSGLEHAIGVIDKSLAKLEAGDWLVVTPDGALANDGVTFTSTEGSMDAGWHRYFESGTADPVASWVSHYNGTETFGVTPSMTHEMRGRACKFPSPDPWSQRGEYAVCVADLDGKLHASIARWTNDVGGDGAGSMVDQPALVGAMAGPACANLAAEEIARLVPWSDAADPEYASISEIARRAGTDPTVPARKYALERFFTTYPVAGQVEPTEFTASDCSYAAPDTTVTFSPAWAIDNALASGMVIRFAQPAVDCFRITSKIDNDHITVSGDCSGTYEGEKFRVMPRRPEVNVNTAPQALLAELLKPPMRLMDDLVETDAESETKATLLAKRLCEKRPFVNRHELEDAIFRVVADVNDNGAIEDLEGGLHLTERQFNDCLNSIAGILTDSDSAFDEPMNPGVYSFDGWEPFGDGVGPAQTLGDCSAADGALAGGTPPTNVTWSTEIKFHSRFFHIYVIGRGWNENVGEPAGVKRLHAIYDAEPGSGKPGKIIWLRWNLSSRGSLTDM